MDYLDRQIIARLHRDARVTAVQMANEFRVTEGTIRRRLKNLIQQGIIRTTVVVSPRLYVNRTIAFLGINTEAAKVREVAETLRKMEVVRYLAFATGAHSLIAQVVVKTHQDLFRLVSDHLAAIPGVTGVNTSVVQEVAKTTYHEAIFRERDLISEQTAGPLRAL